MYSSPSGFPHEDAIRELLHKLGFSNVPNYGSNRETLDLGGQEIDAFGRLDKTYFVIDAKASFSAKGRADGIQTVLEKINGYKSIAIADIKAKFEATHGFHDCVFVLWTNNKKLTTTHQNMARRFGIILRDEYDLKYYQDSLNLIANP